jgi:predicted enzyme related to lactoylglutathione lyase
MSADWPRPIVHLELVARDPGAQRTFYTELFGWDIEAGGLMMFPAGLGAPEGGPGGHISAGERSGFTPYVQVRDLEASARRAVELGGTRRFDRFDIPGGVSMLGIADPEGNPLVLIQQ